MTGNNLIIGRMHESPLDDGLHPPDAIAGIVRRDPCGDLPPVLLRVAFLFDMGGSR